MKAQSINQATAKAVRPAKARSRWRIVERAASEGATGAEAARRAGLTPAGLRSLLYRETGSAAWPPRGIKIAPISRNGGPSSASPAMAAVVSPPPASAGGGEAKPGSWAERHIARRNDARRWLAARGLTPQREQAETATALPKWRVPGWNSFFEDHELIALAESHGMEGADGRA